MNPQFDHVACKACGHPHRVTRKEFRDSGYYLRLIGTCWQPGCECLVRVGCEIGHAR